VRWKGGVTGEERGRCGNELEEGPGESRKIEVVIYLILARGEPEGQVLIAELGLEEGAKVVEVVLTASLVNKDLVKRWAVPERVIVVLVLVV
jgi:hypothetical protein